MPTQPEWDLFRKYTTLHKQFDTLWRILDLRSAGKYHSKRWHLEADNFSVQLSSELGLLTPRIKLYDKEILLAFERGGISGTETFDIAKVIILPAKNSTNVLIAAKAQEEVELKEALGDVCQRPLWYFTANFGTRGACIFCPKPLKHQSSRNVGYGPDCARQQGLYYEYDGPEAKRISSLGVPDDFDYDSL